MIKIVRSTILMLLGMVIAIFIFNIFTREGFYDSVIISGTNLSVGTITNKPSVSDMPTAASMKASSAMPTAASMKASSAIPTSTNTSTTISSSLFDLPSATVTVKPTIPYTQVGTYGMQPIDTQQVTDIAGMNAAASIQKSSTSKKSTADTIAPINNNSTNLPIIGSISCNNSSIDCNDDYDNSDDCNNCNNCNNCN